MACMYTLLTIYNVFNYIYIYMISRGYGINYVLANLIGPITWPFVFAVKQYYYV